MAENKYQAKLFENRIKKRYKHLLKWAKRNKIFCFRLYDRDIPEVPIAADIYFEYTDFKKNESSISNIYDTNKIYVVMFMYKRPYDKPLEEEKNWINCMINSISQVLNISKDRIFFKLREKQKGLSQYKKLASLKTKIIVKEGDCLFHVNLTDYLDTGLFLDHRPCRLKIFEQSKNKKVLNLYSYTGAFSVHALAGGADSVSSVDLSNTYLNIAKDNIKLNKLDESKTFFIKSCVIKFLEESEILKIKWDIIICDPPTFSNSKQADVFDVNKDWKKLCMLCLKCLNTNGVLYFSSNSLRLKFRPEELKEDSKKEHNKNIVISDISLNTIPEDFRNKKIHKMWKIKFSK